MPVLKSHSEAFDPRLGVFTLGSHEIQREAHGRAGKRHSRSKGRG